MQHEFAAQHAPYVTRIDFLCNFAPLFNDNIHAGTTCNATLIHNIIIVPRSSEQINLKPKAYSNCETSASFSGLENFPSTPKQIFTFIKEISFSLSTSPSLFVSRIFLRLHGQKIVEMPFCLFTRPRLLAKKTPDVGLKIERRHVKRVDVPITRHLMIETNSKTRSMLPNPVLRRKSSQTTCHTEIDLPRYGVARKIKSLLQVDPCNKAVIHGRSFPAYKKSTWRTENLCRYYVRFFLAHR